MNVDRLIKVLLIVSIALNLFLLCAGVVVGVQGARMFREGMQAREPMVMRATRALPEEERVLLRQMMRERAVAAAPDMRAAREARREAARLIAQHDYDPTAVAAALARARESDAKARSEIDAAVVGFLPKLDPQSREALAGALVSGRLGGGRRGGRMIFRDGADGPREGRRDGLPPIEAPSPPP